jgi:hypothetical protein
MSGSIDGFPFRTDIWRDETDPDLTRVTIRLDNDILDHFSESRLSSGRGKLSNVMNDALREYIRGAPLEAVVRAAVSEEVRAAKSALTRTS